MNSGSCSQISSSCNSPINTIIKQGKENPSEKYGHKMTAALQIRSSEIHVNTLNTIFFKMKVAFFVLSM